MQQIEARAKPFRRLRPRTKDGGEQTKQFYPRTPARKTSNPLLMDFLWIIYIRAIHAL